MRTIMVAKLKGGVGADTLAHELGVAAAAARKRAVFVTSTMATALVLDCSFVLGR